MRIDLHSSRDCDSASRVLLFSSASYPAKTGSWTCVLSGGDDPLPMFVVIARFWRPASQTLTTGLATITADLATLAFRTGVWSGDSFRASSCGLWRLLRKIRNLAGWCKALDCRKRNSCQRCIRKATSAAGSYRYGTSWMNRVEEACGKSGKPPRTMHWHSGNPNEEPAGKTLLDAVPYKAIAAKRNKS